MAKRRINRIGLVLMLAAPFTVFATLPDRPAEAQVLFYEDFEGSLTLPAFNNGQWVDLTNFTSAAWGNAVGILKETGIAHSGSRSAKLYGNNGEWQTSEMYSAGTISPTEIWVSWWEYLTRNYNITQNHKWFLVQLTGVAGDYYTNFQCNNGGSPTGAEMRIYSQPLDILYGTVTKTLPTEKWYQIKVYYKLNTLGKSDGIIKVWFRADGGSWTVWHNFENVNIRGSAPAVIGSIRIGGSRSDYGVPGISKYIDDVIIGTTEQSVEGPSSTSDKTPPSAPLGLRVQ